MCVRKGMRRLAVAAAVLFSVLLPLLALAAGYEPNTVLVLHVDNLQTIDDSLANHVHRVFDEAARDGNVKAIVLDINTPGGYVQSALKIRDDLLRSKVPTIAFVDDHAYSAGALIALACEKIYMFPTGVLGAAEPIPETDKNVSALKAEFKAIAGARGRDVTLAQAMVDKNQGAPGQQSGQVMTFTADEALRVHLADGQATGIDDALRQAGLTGYHLQDVRPSTAEYAARILTNGWVATLLLLLGIAGIAIEFVKPGVTLPGLVGTVSLGLFFIGNFLTGSAGWLELGLFLLGGVLFAIEVAVPGHAIFGIGGAVSVLASIFLSVNDPTLAALYLAVAGVGFALLLFLLFRRIGRRGLGKMLTLERTAEGYVPSRKELDKLVGSVGVALSVLRPSGSAEVAGRRIDVVTQGEFLPAGQLIEVIRVDGARVTVRAAQK